MTQVNDLNPGDKFMVINIYQLTPDSSSIMEDDQYTLLKKDGQFTTCKDSLDRVYFINEYAGIVPVTQNWSEP